MKVKINYCYLLALAGLCSLIFTDEAKSQIFSEISLASKINHLHLDEHYVGGGVAVFDFNNDGFLDIYFTGGNNQDHLYINKQNNEFEEIGSLVGLDFTSSIPTVGVTTGDIDNDGFEDILVTTRNDFANILLHNNGDGTVTDISTGAGIIDKAWNTSASFGDYNMDGYLDIYIASYVSYVAHQPAGFYLGTMTPQANFFYVNNGDLTFNEMSKELGLDNMGAGLAVTFTDFDNDNDLDIYLANDYGNFFGGNVLFENKYPEDTFVDVTKEARMNFKFFAMGIAIGDYDNNNSLDMYVTNIGNNFLLRNNLNKTFTDKAANSNVQCSGPNSWGTFFFDYDNDGYLDIFTATGGVFLDSDFLHQENHLFKGGPSRIFKVISDESFIPKTRSRGAAYGDFDNDGNLDVALVNVDSDNNSSDKSWLLQNNNVENNWLQVKLQGTRSNRNGFGAKIRVYNEDRIWLHEVSGGSSYLSNNSSTAHFGLGMLTEVDSVVVSWLGGNDQVTKNVSSNQLLKIIEQCIDFEILTLKVCQEEGMLIGGVKRSKSGVYEEVIASDGSCDLQRTINLTVEKCVVADLGSESISDADIYPNPSNRYINIELGEGRSSLNSVSLFNLVGVRLEGFSFNGQKAKIDLGAYPSGTYILNLENGFYNKSIRLIKK